MNKTIFTLMASLVCMPSLGEDVIIKRTSEKQSHQAFVPILVDFDQEKLTIQFMDRKDYDIEVVGQEGTVVERSHAEEDSPVLRIDMNGNKKGTYEILIQDEEGNTLKGNFEKKQ